MSANVRFVVQTSRRPAPRSKYETRFSISVGSSRDMIRALPFRHWPTTLEGAMTEEETLTVAMFYYASTNIGKGYKKRLVKEVLEDGRRTVRTLRRAL